MKQLPIELTQKFAKLLIIVSRSQEIVLDNRVVIDLAVEKLLDAETLDGVEFRKLVREYHTYQRKLIKYFNQRLNNFITNNKTILIYSIFR
jgi:beta-glucosidase/6-phospho-beta-glucosidase/beta-galactosidase